MSHSLPQFVEGPDLFPGPIASSEPVALPSYSTEVFDCPSCRFKIQRGVGRGIFLQPKTCPRCNARLDCDLKPEDRVSLELWDETERPANRLGECSVAGIEVARCQSGFLITIADDEGTPIARLDRAWLLPVKG